MSHHNTQEDRIALYLSGWMEEEEKQIFEQEIKDDPKLALAVQTFDEERTVTEHYLEQDLRQKMEQWSSEENNQHTLKKNRNNYYYWVLFFSVLAIIALLLFINPKTPTEETPTETEEAPTQAEVTSVERAIAALMIAPELPSNSLGEADWENAKAAYAEKDYQGAVDLLGILTNSNTEIDYYLSHSLLQIGEYTQSRDIFLKISEGNSIYNQKAEWYYLIAQYHTGEFDKEDQALLLKISQDEFHPFQQQGKILREYLIPKSG
ncbi:MAG: hypothetical protein MI974_18855 [Chitinophagales bacterium]|nr:hypothetical protein [Chitinophagales bacterium]